MLPLSTAFYQGGRYYPVQAVTIATPGLGSDSMPVLPSIDPVELSPYYQNVIRYYKNYGYIPNASDRKWFESNIGKYEIKTNQEGQYVFESRRERPRASPYDEPEDIGISKYAWLFSGGFTDETLPQAISDYWFRTS